MAAGTRETKRQLKERLQASGHWQDFLRLRAELVQEGRTPKEAKRAALRRIEGPPSPQADPVPRESEDGSPANPADDRSPATEEELPEYPLCSQCERHGRPTCKACWENACRALKAA